MFKHALRAFRQPRLLAALIASAAVSTLTLLPTASQASQPLQFNMVRSPGLASSPSCAAHAKATVRITPAGPYEIMDVVVQGLPPNTDFDFFVIQQPNAPFGMSWYQGDIETNSQGVGGGRFVGRFNSETFIVAPGTPIAAPSVHHHAFPDATLNPTTAPLHTYHLGLWFNSPTDAAKAGCPGNVTPFNGEHDAGVQVLNTSNFPALAGPLLKVQP